jgi:rhodanese-related sulfurtransferase
VSAESISPTSTADRAPAPGRRRAHRLLAGAAAALAILALAAGDAPSAGGRVDVAALARTVEAEQDHVDAIELAAWIRAGKLGLRVIDVRGAEDFSAFHLPNAENLSLTELTRAPIGRDETVVLYSEGGAHAAQGWFFLRARGIERVYFLRGGLYEWLTEVVNPTLPADASPAQRAVFARTAELSRYFGGQPRIGGPAAESTDDPAAELPHHEHAEEDGTTAELHGTEEGEGTAAPARDPAAELPRRSTEDGDGTAAAIRRVRQRGC